jgi:hypothetical protein
VPRTPSLRPRLEIELSTHKLFSSCDIKLLIDTLQCSLSFAKLGSPIFLALFVFVD